MVRMREMRKTLQIVSDDYLRTEQRIAARVVPVRAKRTIRSAHQVAELYDGTENPPLAAYPAERWNERLRSIMETGRQT